MNEQIKRIIVDFDNTMGVPSCDVDDALALLFLLGNKELCTIEGLTTTYGNSNINTVYRNTVRIADDLGLDLPIFKGAAAAEKPISEAAEFLAETVSSNPSQISVLAIGSLTNLKGAAFINPSFFSNIADIYLMGGVTRTLTVNGTIVDELNFSCDPDAALMTLGAPCPVTDAVSQNCLPCLFSKQELIDEFGENSWLVQECHEWFATMQASCECEEFVCWDIVAAAYAIRPDLFVDDICDISLYRRWLGVGLLEICEQGDCDEGVDYGSDVRSSDVPRASVNLPRIKDAAALKRAIFDSWHRALDYDPKYSKNTSRSRRHG